MSLNSTPSSDRTHIGIFGKRNAGKSSLINAITGQNLAIVSEVLGTTTDPVSKAMELLPLGPVVITDTPGIDDLGELGEARVKKSYETLSRTDIAVVVADEVFSDTEEKLIKKIEEKNIPYIKVINKCENITERLDGYFYVSAKTGENINNLKEEIARLAKDNKALRRIVGDFIEAGDIVVLVIPIDASAPKGRLILPQQQTIRDILDSGAAAVCVRDTELSKTLEKIGKPKLVITDSQAFGRVSKDVPEDVNLTSFSILMSRYKGTLLKSIKAVRTIDTLEDGDTILISEGCTHHRQCEDIGTVKIPNWIREYTGKNINFKFTSGGEFPEDLSEYKMIVHCGGCMLNEREMMSRSKHASDSGVPMTNYGLLIAHINGILDRSIKPLPDITKELGGNI